MTDIEQKALALVNEVMDKKIEICVVGKRCVYINDFRVAGGKPYVSENLPQHSFHVRAQDIFEAFSTDQIEAELKRRERTTHD